MKKLRVLIIGSGNIGTDLLIKVQRSTKLQCVGFVGRSYSSKGMQKAASLGVRCSDRSVEFIINNQDDIDLVFDATSAKFHLESADIYKKLGIKVIDMTPAKLGGLCVPSVNMGECSVHQNVNMITCGGQASIPLAYALSKVYDDIEYIETVSSIASKSAGPATRANLDEYIATTEYGLKYFTGAQNAKAILNLNPAIPCVNMQTTLLALVDPSKIEEFSAEVEAIVKEIQLYVPGYELIVPPKYENGRVITTVRVKGMGDYLPEYAGNLDIINCAAIAMAEEYANNE